MNSGKADLFHLIKSMSKSEKRYFKMESKKAGDKTSNHIKLFDAINKMEEYDEDILKKKLKKETFVRHLSAEKRYLYQAVLKSIRNFRADQSIFAQIKSLVIDANILMERSLNNQAKKLLDKAAKLAEKIDDTISLLEINLKKQLLSIRNKKKDHKGVIEQLMKEKDEIINFLLKKLELRDILNKTGYAQMEDNRAQIIEHIKGKESLLKQHEEHPSFYAQLWTYGIYGNYHQGTGKLQKLINIRSKTVDLWNQHPVIKEEFFHQYIVDLANISVAYFTQGQTEKAIEYMKILENERPKTMFDQVYIFEKVSNKKLIYNMSIGDFETAKSFVPKIEFDLESLPIRKTSSTTIKSNIAVLYFCLEDFKQCLTWTDKVINAPKSNIRLDIQKFNRLLAIIAQIELEDGFEIIDNFCRATHRFLTKNSQKKSHNNELIMLDFLWKYHKTAPKDQKEILTQFKNWIETTRKHPIKKLTSGLEEFHFWTRSRLEKKPIALLIKESNSPSG